MDIKNLFFSYHAKEPFIAIDELKISEGKITTIIGPNGCGKSTLLALIAQQLTYTAGEIYIEQQNISRLSRKELAKKLAIVYQQNEAPEQYTIRDLVKVGRYPYRKGLNSLSADDLTAIDKAIELTGLVALQDQRLAELSGGQRQRAWIALALAQETQYLLLDEPTTYLDLHHQFEILDCIEKLNKNANMTIIMVLHDLNQAFQYSDEVIVMSKGKIIKSGQPTVTMSEELIKGIFGINVQIIEDIEKNKHILPLRK
ncbi:ABC transporter ATP-binding protein [Kurthia sibirica]|uniref:Iron ABC transporter ATP-binding protein n=1 Tax=Kurthia sibirica TaxID=202750 RepID=A0A2U3AIQ1_9BACL|nr:ABC transporter ATP-binding protein [Kurthia sibirica]PWI24418.1 iron ABC transporter ATP-binding protein [Kurthia sibirica]GEK33836.1 iron ABC transporter ATP-binding protein [Kurthia sibirica]